MNIAHLRLLAGLIVSILISPASADSGPGVGPVSKVDLQPVSAELAKKGLATFSAKCTACHKLGERYVGPALWGVTGRRRPEWIMNMILNPAQMLQEDDTAKELLGEFLTPMTFQNVSQEDARAILEYFRDSDSKPVPVAQPSAAPAQSKATGTAKAKKSK